MIGKGFNVKVTEKDRSGKVIRTLKELETSGILVGIPDARTERKLPSKMSSLQKLRSNLGQGMITNAELLYVHTNGSPIRHIPARPVVEPAINASDNKRSITDEMKEAAKAALDGNKQGMKAFLRRAALDAQNRVRAWFTDSRNAWSPNAPSTIRRKGSDRPLIDTSQMRNNIVGIPVVEGRRG